MQAKNTLDMQEQLITKVVNFDELWLSTTNLSSIETSGELRRQHSSYKQTSQSDFAPHSW